MSKLKDVIIPICLGVLAFIGVLIVPGSFLVHPVFDIEYEALENGGIEKISVTNTGWVQAKNVKINLYPGDITSIEYEDCPEGVIGSDWDFSASPKMKFERMSTNLSCEFTVLHFKLDGNPEKFQTTEKITVTADDSPAYVWKHEKPTTESLSDKFVTGLMEALIAFVAVTAGTAAYKIARKFIGSL